MAHDKEVSIAAGAWGADVEPWLAQALATSTMQDLKKQHQDGAVLFRVLSEGQTVGAFLLRIDDEPTGKQGVIVAAAAALGGVDMVHTVVPIIESRFVGIASIRFHTQSRALVRKMQALGYAQQEFICVKPVQGIQ